MRSEEGRGHTEESGLRHQYFRPIGVVSAGEIEVIPFSRQSEINEHSRKTAGEHLLAVRWPKRDCCDGTKGELWGLPFLKSGADHVFRFWIGDRRDRINSAGQIAFAKPLRDVRKRTHFQNAK